MTTTTIMISNILLLLMAIATVFRRIDCHGDGYDDVAGDFDDEHGDCIS